MLDATIAYSDEPAANLFTWWCGKSQTVSVYWRVVEFTPDQDEASFRAELFELWKEKDQLLEYYLKHNHFPSNNNQGEAKW